MRVLNVSLHKDNFSHLPTYAAALGNPVKLPKTICNRFMQPLMETVCNRLSSYLPCYATAYGNGVSLLKIPRTAAPILKKS